MIGYAAFQDPRREDVLLGDAREQLRKLESNSVQCVVTSPPYWGLRDYGGPDLIWGGDPACDHEWIELPVRRAPDANRGLAQTGNGAPETRMPGLEAVPYPVSSGATCNLCGAWNGQLGLEPTPQDYVMHLLEVFTELWRVLREDGVCWLNLGDSYNAYNGNRGASSTTIDRNRGRKDAELPGGHGLSAKELKNKDLVGIPWWVAFTLRSAGWYLRADVIWRKPNPMPASVRDRPTSSHEHVFLLTKKPRYHYDWLAVVEPFVDARMGRDKAKVSSVRDVGGRTDGFTKPNNVDPSKNGGKNRRDVWTEEEDEWTTFQRWLDWMREQGEQHPDVWDITTRPFKGAHFAVFPPALASICARAGTSPVACGTCGTPWKRLVEKARPIEQTDRIKNLSLGQVAGTGGAIDGGTSSTTLGLYAGEVPTTDSLEPACSHYDPTGRCLVVDPFAGASTTGVVAAELGLDFVGCELVPDYAEMGRERLGVGTM